MSDIRQTGDASASNDSGEAGVVHERNSLVGAIIEAHSQCEDGKRLVVGVAGAPASGKSTLAQWLVDRINEHSPAQPRAIVVPMDGYHLDNAILEERNLMAVKGAPDTFDVMGFLILLQRLASAPAIQSDGQSAWSRHPIHIPVFDRRMDLARCAAASVTEQHRIVIVEGNYLLLKRPVWEDVSTVLDLSVMLDVPIPVLEQRLIQRWIDFGLPEDAARERALSNDIPNARVVNSESSCAQLILRHQIN